MKPGRRGFMVWTSITSGSKTLRRGESQRAAGITVIQIEPVQKSALALMGCAVPVGALLSFQYSTVAPPHL